ncbi:MAG: MarC family protein [Pseudohongiellaceae bacterium]
MLETATVALATFFATVGPLDVAAVFAALTTNFSRERRRQMAVRGTVIASCIMLLFAVTGQWVLDLLGISLPALRTAGGILLLLIGIDMVFARTSGSTTTTQEETQEARAKQDISVFPLATPLIAGPGAMGAVVLLMANAEGDLVLQAVVIASLLVILLFTLAMMFLSAQIDRLLGVTGMHVVTRIMGILLTSLAVQFIFDGVAQSGLLDGA